MIGEISSLKNPVIDTGSQTWAAVVKAVAKERIALLESMVSERRTEKERDSITGKIKALDWVTGIPNRKDVFEGIE
jgi:hypothetical protein